MKAKLSLKAIGLMALAAALTPLTFALGAAPMLVMRRALGRLAFWFPLLAVSFAFIGAGLVIEGVSFIALTVLIGTFKEVEDHGGSTFTSAAVGVLASVGTTALFWGMGRYTGINLVSHLRQQLTPAVDMIRSVDSSTTVTVDMALQQVPSSFLISLLCGLFVALLLERLVSALFRLPMPAPRDLAQTFKVPDFVMWLAIVSAAAAYIEHGYPVVQIVAANAVKVIAAVYFFQGLAVLSKAFDAFKITGFWRSIWYAMFILQLYTLVLIGLADYWLNFRERMQRRTAEAKKKEFEI